MSTTTLQQLEIYGPERCETLSVAQARHWCRRLVRGRYENFSVLSRLVPKELRDDFAAVYAFCRWADDLGDEIGDPARALELLAWWRRELEQCFAGEPRHPVFLALRPTIERHSLPIKPFDDLIRAFEQDQRLTRYETWDELLGYCTLSANPVGRLVLMICGEKRDEPILTYSDATCTALQLTNHWQDVKRDILERDRIYIPRDMIDVPDFETRLIASARQGWAVDREFLGQYRAVLRRCVERTWPLFEKGEELLAMVGPATAPIAWLLAAGGQRVLRMIELWNYETALHRPRLSKPAKLGLIVRAWLLSRSRAAGRNGAGLASAESVVKA